MATYNGTFVYRHLRGRPELSSSSKEHAGGGGQWPSHAFKNVDYDALQFHTGSVKSIDIFRVLFLEGGGHKKEYSVYTFDNVDNYGGPLTSREII